MLQRFKDALQAGRAAVDAASGLDRKAANIAWLVIEEMGADAPHLRSRFLDATEDEDAETLVILSALSDLEHSDLKRRCEYLVLPEDVARVTGESPDVIEVYLANRLFHILSKWDIRTCFWSGDRAAGLVDLVLSKHPAVADRTEFPPLAITVSPG